MIVLQELFLKFLKMKINKSIINNKIFTTTLLVLSGIIFPFYIGILFLFVGIFMNWFGLTTVLLFALLRVSLFSSGSRNFFFEGFLIIGISLCILIIKKYIRKKTNSYDFI